MDEPERVPSVNLGAKEQEVRAGCDERRSQSTEDLLSRGELGAKKRWGYQKSRQARSSTDNSSTSIPLYSKQHYKSKQVEAAEPSVSTKHNATHTSSLSPFKLPLSPRLMNSFPLSPRMRLPTAHASRTAPTDKEDEEGKGNDSVAAASFQPNFRYI